MPAPTIVQHVEGNPNTGITIAKPTIGNMICVLLCNSSGSPPASFSDTDGNIYSLKIQHSNASPTNQIWTAPVTANGSTHIVTGAATSCWASVIEITGFDPETPFDGTPQWGIFTGTGPAVVPTSPGIVCTYPFDLLLSVAQEGNSNTLTVNTGTAIGTPGVHANYDLFQQHTTTIEGTYAEAINAGAQSDRIVICAIAFMGADTVLTPDYAGVIARVIRTVSA